MLEEIMDTHYEPINWGLGEIRAFKRATGALAEKIESAPPNRPRAISPGWSGSWAIANGSTARLSAGVTWRSSPT